MTATYRSGQFRWRDKLSSLVMPPDWRHDRKQAN